MARDAAETRSRILSAAKSEFAEYGFAGARVDRIAEVAACNKRMIYVYFSDKDGLFDSTLLSVITDMMNAVPITEDDLPAYAGSMFDYLVAHPEALRLSMWRQLERPASGPDMAALYTSKAEALAGSDPGGYAGGPFPAVDLLVLVQGMAGAWLISPIDLLAADGSDPMSAQRLAIHRSTLVAAVALLTTQSSS